MTGSGWSQLECRFQCEVANLGSHTAERGSTAPRVYFIRMINNVLGIQISRTTHRSSPFLISSPSYHPTNTPTPSQLRVPFLIRNCWTVKAVKWSEARPFVRRSTPVRVHVRVSVLLVPGVIHVVSGGAVVFLGVVVLLLRCVHRLFHNVY